MICEDSLGTVHISINAEGKGGLSRIVISASLVGGGQILFFFPFLFSLFLFYTSHILLA